MPGIFRFSFGPWNIHEGEDPFGPKVRNTIDFSSKLELYGKLGFEGVQFHDDDAVPDLDGLTPEQIEKRAGVLKKVLDDHGLTAEFVAPRLWMDPRTIDGGYTSNDSECRRYALERSLRCVDIARALGIDPEQVGVKATTEEHLGFTGDGSGMTAHAVALVERN